MADLIRKRWFQALGVIVLLAGFFVVMHFLRGRGGGGEAKGSSPAGTGVPAARNIARLSDSIRHMLALPIMCGPVIASTVLRPGRHRESPESNQISILNPWMSLCVSNARAPMRHPVSVHIWCLGGRELERQLSGGLQDVPGGSGEPPAGS